MFCLVVLSSLLHLLYFYQGRTKLLTTLTDTIKAEKEQAQKKFDEEVEGMKKQLTEKTNDISEKGKLIQKVCFSTSCFDILFSAIFFQLKIV